MGPKIKEARKAADLTMEALAELVDVTKQTVKEWEAGRRQPSIDNLRLLAQAVGKPAAWFLEEGDAVATFSFAERLKAARQESDLTLEAIAGHLGISVQAYLKWERGASLPEGKRLDSIAEVFGKPVAWFFLEADGAEQRRPLARKPSNRFETLERALLLLVDELAETRKELVAVRKEQKLTRASTRALRKRIESAEAALESPAGPGQAGEGPLDKSKRSPGRLAG